MIISGTDQNSIKSFLRNEFSKILRTFLRCLNKPRYLWSNELLKTNKNSSWRPCVDIVDILELLFILSDSVDVKTLIIRLADLPIRTWDFPIVRKLFRSISAAFCWCWDCYEELFENMGSDEVSRSGYDYLHHNRACIQE